MRTGPVPLQHPLVPRPLVTRAIARAERAANADAIEQAPGVLRSHQTGLPALDATTRRIIDTTAALVRIPSQGGIDDSQAICSALVSKLADAGMKGRVLMKGTRPVGVVAEIVGAHPGPTYALNAVVDTAPVGDAKRWSMPPFSAELRGNRLYGRGVGDSKVAAAMFIEVGRQLAQRTGAMHGRAVLFFDAAEHVGDFAGMRTFVEQYGTGPDRVQGMVIGYPGNDSLQIGSRGFHRSQWRTALATPGAVEATSFALSTPQTATLPEGRSIEFPLPTKRTVTAVSCEIEGPQVGEGVILDISISGKSGHTGASANLGVNAITKAAAFLRDVRRHGAMLFGDAFAPTVVGLEGGKDFSVVPDLVRVKLFVPSSIPERAARHIATLALAEVDGVLPASAPSTVDGAAKANGERAVSAVTVNADVRTTMACDPDDIQTSIDKAMVAFVMTGIDCKASTVGSCPAFRLRDESPLSRAMQKAINRHSSKPVQPRISGPSNAGNIAAEVGIEATAGFGAACKHAHGADESIDVTTLAVAMAVHVDGMETLFEMKPPERAASLPQSAFA